METLKSTANLLSLGAYMVSIDLKDAYYHVPIHVDHQKYLRVAIYMGSRVAHFQYQALPFGVTVAPRVFTKVIAEMAAHIREEPGVFIPYLDDFLLIGDTFQDVKRQLDRTLKILSRLGWQINWEKSSLVPSQTKQFLGIIIDSKKERFFLPQRKIEAIESQIAPLLLEPKTSVRKAMSLLGLLTATFPAVTWAQVNSRQLQLQILQSWDKLSASLDRDFCLSPSTQASLTWWLDRENLLAGRPWRLESLKVLTTDASGIGWGAHLGDLVFQGQWGPEIAGKSSNYRELYTVLLALQAAKQALVRSHVQIQSDNATTVAYINKQGGTRSQELMDLTFRIFSLAEGNFQSLSAVFLRGKLNQQADFLSRQTLHQGEWSLNKVIFRKVSELWGVPEIDLFSSKKNRQVSQFCSLNPADRPWAVDAFSVPWKWKLAYAFPPISLIPRVLKKIREDQARIILVAPFWPKRAWFSLLRDLSVTDPWVLPEQEDLLAQGPIYHPQVENLHLTAWMLSGTCSRQKGSQIR